MCIAIVIGSIRAARLSDRPALYLKTQFEQAGHQVDLVDLRELNLPVFADNPEMPAGAHHFIESIKQADGVVLVSPEYNHTYGSALKNALDYLRKQELMHIPLACVGVSNGFAGGVRALLMLRASIPTLGAVLTPMVVPVPMAADTFPNPDGQTCTNEKVSGQLATLVKELGVYSEHFGAIKSALQG